MRRFLSFAIVASFAGPAEARVHIFKDVVVNGSRMAALKTLYVDADRNHPAIINVEKISCMSHGGTEASTGGVVFAPASVAVNMLSKWIKCSPSLELVPVGSQNVLISRATKCGTNLTQKMAFAFSGTYILYGAICGSPETSATFEVKVAGDQFDAYERGWSFLFSIYLMIHVVLLAVLEVYRKNCAETMGAAAFDDMSIASRMAVLAHGVGFVSCFVLEPIPFLEMAHTSLWAGTMSSVMLAMITVSGIGCSEPNPNWRLGYWILFFTVLAASLYEHGRLFEKYGRYPGDTSPITKLGAQCWGIAGSFFIFGFICVRLLARSFRSFQHKGLLECVAVLRKVTVVIAVYTGLGVAGAASMAYDVPSGEPGFHRVVGGASTQVTQIFGLGVILHVLWGTKFDTEYACCVGKTIGNASPDDEMSMVHNTSSAAEKGENLGVNE